MNSQQVNFWVGRHIKGQSVANAAGAFAVGLLANIYARFGYYQELRFVRWCRKSVKPRLLEILPPRLIKFMRGGGDRRGKLPSTYGEGVDTPLASSRNSSITSLPTNSAAGTPSGSGLTKSTYGLAAAAMLPAIWVQVPSGLAVSGSLVGGITSANQITHNTTGVSVAQSGSQDQNGINSVVLTVGYSVIQIAVGITVGLFLSTVVVYPRGKKKGGVFTM